MNFSPGETQTQHAHLVEQETSSTLTSAAYCSPEIRPSLFYFLLGSYWIGYNAWSASTASVIWPSQIKSIVGDDKKAFYNGLIPAFGALLSLVLTPIAGALSDASRSRFGRRRPYIVVGTIVAIVFSFLSAPFGSGSNIWLYLVPNLGTQAGLAASAGAFTGLMPDLVTASKHGAASGYLGLFTAIGSLVGAIVAGVLTKPNEYWAVYIAIIVIIGVFTVPTLALREQPLHGVAPPFNIVQFAKSFVLSGPEYRDFWWVVLARFWFDMGVYGILPFFQYYFADVLHEPNPELMSSILVVTIVTLSIPTSLLGGFLSDKYGRKPLVYISTSIMVVAQIVLIICTSSPSRAVVFVVGALFGLGYGIYQSVDWALAIDVCPSSSDIAKDMGVWHCAMVLPTVISPFISGLILDSLKDKAYTTAYLIIFAMIILYLILAAVFVRPVKLLPNRRHVHTDLSEDTFDLQKADSETWPRMLSEDFRSRD
mmetsp:Transcript_4736/g.7365  ORF Transcript_4736/g.7365 Transcript_4736/m.7365 type:complete len:482 (+) Transcript_4736:128-1573(+)|eukprot:CAMPEP_0184660888 /NCGR_PEP_ID=MMETSP0308-20130426/35841_1 /TAXON_ID=38269 /ORGANISM="Gloeochaete witrockiana, Strain SAG 46.84" /LENGTH=481 /DNA_ID=CAMNT_0027101803 /DNA_START=76 /DNA_END=1521 /DNA_ORIENTATION=-